MSKPMLVTLPCLIVLLEWWPLGRASARPRRSDLATLAFAALALAACVVTLIAQSAGGALRDLVNWPFGLRLENALDAYVWYLAANFWPSGLTFHYPLGAQELGGVQLVLDAALLAALGCGAFCLRRRLPALLVGWLWFVGLLVPVIGLVQVGGQAHADRYTYLPCLGLLLALCATAERELLPRIGARALAALALVAAAALALQSWRQIGTWRDSEVLARRALAVTRDNLVACDVLGSYYTNTGRNAEALPVLREAVRIAPEDAEALTNLGGTLLRDGQLQESEQLLLHAIHVAPRRWQAWSLLGGLYLALQRNADALSALERAVELEPRFPGSWLNRGRALEALGRHDEAQASFARARATPAGIVR
jgi:tetratricopeptide (TPR) repeat protein